MVADIFQGHRHLGVAVDAGLVQGAPLHAEIGGGFQCKMIERLFEPNGLAHVLGRHALQGF